MAHRIEGKSLRERSFIFLIPSHVRNESLFKCLEHKYKDIVSVPKRSVYLKALGIDDKTEIDLTLIPRIAEYFKVEIDITDVKGNTLLSTKGKHNNRVRLIKYYETNKYAYIKDEKPQCCFICDERKRNKRCQCTPFFVYNKYETRDGKYKNNSWVILENKTKASLPSIKHMELLLYDQAGCMERAVKDAIMFGDNIKFLSMTKFGHYNKVEIEHRRPEPTVYLDVSSFFLGVRYVSELEDTFIKEFGCKISTKEVINKFRTFLHDKFQIDMCDFLSLSQMTYYLWYRSVRNTWGEFALYLPTKEQGKFIEQSIRTPLIKSYPGTYKGEFVELDVNSLYPYVMANNVFPMGEGRWVDVYNTEELEFGFYKVSLHNVNGKFDVRSHRHYPIFPLQKVNEYVMNHIDIQEFRKMGAIVKFIGQALIFPESGKVFERYVKPIYELKKHNQGFMREIYKHMLNDLWGKTIEKRLNNKYYTYKSQEELKNILTEVKAQGNFVYELKRVGDKGRITVHETNSNPYKKPNYLGSYVLAYARKRMRELIGSVPYLKTHTDSFLIDRKYLDKFKTSDDDMGEFKIDTDHIIECIIDNANHYQYKCADGNVKNRGKYGRENKK